MKLFYYFALMGFAGLTFSCNTQKEKKFTIDDAYLVKMEQYQHDLLEGRKYYLKIASLYPLEKGMNTFGADSSNDLQLHVASSPGYMGGVKVSHDSIFFIPSDALPFSHPKDSSLIKEPTYLPLLEYARTAILYNDRFKLQVLIRNSRPYLRIWDDQNPAIDAFEGFPSYELSPSFMVEGQFHYYEKPKSVEAPSMMGGTETTTFIGQVSFTYQGNSYTLDVGEEGFTMIKDQTSGKDTYGGGRYFSIDLPQQDSAVLIDFNKLYNPPCAFSDFTVCLFAPRQNVLPFAITAGERYESHF